MTRSRIVIALLCAAVGIASADTHKPAKPAKPAATTPAATPAPAEAPPDPVGSAAAADADPNLPPHLTGPTLVDLHNDTEIDLPTGMILLEKVEAQKILAASADTDENVVAAIVKPESAWLLVIDYLDVGYVKDDDANSLDAGEMLDSYREGAKEQNKERTAKGIPELFVDGWLDKPTYERAAHHLVWGINAHSSKGPSVNSFTRILGRRGYLSVDLIADADKIAAAKLEAAPILAALRFKTGGRYEDYIVGKDKDSGVGLKGLVLGGAGVAILAKTGLLLKILLIFKKGFLLVFAAIGGFFKMLFGRKKKADATAMPPTVAASSPPPPIGPHDPTDPNGPPGGPSNPFGPPPNG